jgi:replicative DNA helicase
MKKKLPIDAKPMDLGIVKNRLGPTGTVPLLYVAAASVFEERKP